MSGGCERGEVTLRNGDLAVRVSRHGGAITFAEYRATPFLVAGGGPNKTMASFPLVPFGNRVAGNAMSFDGRDYRFRPNSAGPLYLHGDGWLTLWEVEGEEPQCVRLGFSRIADDVSPYSYQARQEIGISGNTLVLDLSVTNRGEAALPFGLGHHPFFPRTPKTRLTAGAQVFWSEREGHLPGERRVVPDTLCFADGKTLSRQWANNAFEGWKGQASIAWPEFGLQVVLDADPVFSSYMIYMPIERPDFFCFEPMSHLPDGHHMQDLGGLTVLAPGESLSGRVSIRLSPLVTEFGES
jgi:aldose 1-epimerase